MPTAITSAKGQIVIPKEVRDKLGITPGKKVLFRIVDKHAEITPLPDDPIKAMRGILKGGASLAQELLDERKRDNKFDDGHSF
ncbi:MAG TPA: AbrB/MazE/SpoVT family DNA-binding domain-containing protein [Desulfobacteraceae bacterium]|nr:AbrB/MazE/SpoVT family DNA-binding domain-containing protein [Desulfobacteraceae bacterium]HPJ68954.1 AbrB/MazE/SpoVT family DNA-binding domain-containing protein [Desulfobacteraceae bacterium]HPQ28485.1 AbrB/MazE/SpoVT family DNA-binding domain-containing protein [Desulfobacteraceae bacterium]